MTTSDHDRSEGQPRRPTWQQLPCPDWCERMHEEDDHPEDRYHQSEPSFIPLTAATERTVPVTASLRNVDLLVRVGQYVDELIEWVVIEPLDMPQPRLVMTVESAHSLVRGLTEQLDRHDVG